MAQGNHKRSVQKQKGHYWHGKLSFQVVKKKKSVGGGSLGQFYRADIRKLSRSYNWEPNQANQSEEHIQSAILRKRKDNGNYK